MTTVETILLALVVGCYLSDLFLYLENQQMSAESDALKAAVTKAISDINGAVAKLNSLHAGVVDPSELAQMTTDITAASTALEAATNPAPPSAG